MKILTWNINGIRSMDVPIPRLLERLDADVVCFQETKVTRDQLDERTAIVEGYSSYFSFSRKRAGYSGVATYCRQSVTPYKAEEGLTGLLHTAVIDRGQLIDHYGNQEEFTDEELKALDMEGRTIVTQHKIRCPNDDLDVDLYIINVYCPRADPSREDRKLIKMKFYEALQLRAETLLASGGHVVIVGDVNTAHRLQDHCDPANDKEFSNHSGRKWLTQFLCDTEIKEVEKPRKLNESLEMSGGYFTDTFRYMYPNKTNAFTCWDTSSGARKTNYGTRIDYIFADCDLAKRCLDDCVILSDVEGSDHCPVVATLNFNPVPSTKLPGTCTQCYPEFSGRQQKLSSFFTKAKTVDNCVPDTTEQESKGLKRKVEDDGQNQQVGKLSKTKSSNSGGQKSLISFFGAKPTQPSNRSNSQEENTKPLEHPVVKANIDVMQTETESRRISGTSSAWKSLFQGPVVPSCKGHGEPCVLRTVNKKTLNQGRKFYVCARPEGLSTNPDARCDHFEWKDKKK